jgi:multidrug efflux system membrane fusion protein
MDTQTPVAETRTVQAPPRRGRRVWWVALLLLVLAVVLFWWHPWRGAPPHAPATPPQAVGDAAAVSGDMPVVLSELGTVTPLATVTVQTQINGQLTDVGFQEGQYVHRGDFLAQIDPRPYQAALEQAQGTLAKDRALLADARLDLKRYQTLNRQDSVARQTLDTQAALVQQDEGQVVTDQAAVDTQKLNLVYCHITAPVEGRVGLRLVDPGNYVQTSSSTGLAVITQIKPMSVIFTVAEDDIPQIAKRLAAGAKLQTVALDRADTTQIATGVLQTVDNQIDTTTGTVKIRAIFANQDGALFPNQFVNVNLLVNTLHNAVLVPNAAIQRGAPGTFVYLVGADNVVSVRKVKLGPGDAKNTAILDGLAVGDHVVTDGADRLRDGSKVFVPPPAGSAPAAGGTAGGADGSAAPAHKHHHHQETQ